MKKLISMLLLLVMICAVAGCAKKQDASSDSKEESKAEESKEEPSEESEASEESSEDESAEEESEERYLAPPEAFAGLWECDRASIEITQLPPADDGQKFHVLVNWGSGANEMVVWEYECYYDGVAGLASVETGTKTILTWDENDEMQSEVVFEDGATSLYVNEDGTLTWNEYKEDAGEGMVFTLVGPVETPEDEGAEQNEDAFLGVWQCGRATITITSIHPTEQNENYRVLVSWSSSAAETTTWEYLCYYDGMGLASFEKGVKSNIVFDENDDATVEIVFTDGSTALILNEDGTLTWNEFKEDAGKDMAFESLGTIDFMPPAEAVANDYFRVIAAVPHETAGAAIQMAKAACEVVRFANNCQIEYVDREGFRAALLEAWEGLTEEEQTAFDANFMDIVALIDASLENPDTIEAGFADAGVADEMAVLLGEAPAVDSWKALSSLTLTMGNSEQ